MWRQIECDVYWWRPPYVTRYVDSEHQTSHYVTSNWVWRLLVETTIRHKIYWLRTPYVALCDVKLSVTFTGGDHHTSQDMLTQNIIRHKISNEKSSWVEQGPLFVWNTKFWIKVLDPTTSPKWDFFSFWWKGAPQQSIPRPPALHTETHTHTHTRTHHTQTHTHTHTHTYKQINQNIMCTTTILSISLLHAQAPTWVVCSPSIGTRSMALSLTAVSQDLQDLPRDNTRHE